MTRTSMLDVPPVTIEQSKWIPSAEQVRASFDPEDLGASDITTLLTVCSGASRVSIERFDFGADDTDSVIEARIEIAQPGNPVDEYIEHGGGPQVVWRRLTELASAASLAAHRLQSMMDGGHWI